MHEQQSILNLNKFLQWCKKMFCFSSFSLKMSRQRFAGFPVHFLPSTFSTLVCVCVGGGGGGGRFPCRASGHFTHIYIERERDRQTDRQSNLVIYVQSASTDIFERERERECMCVWLRRKFALCALCVCVWGGGGGYRYLCVCVGGYVTDPCLPLASFLGLMDILSSTCAVCVYGGGGGELQIPVCVMGGGGGQTPIFLLLLCQTDGYFAPYLGHMAWRPPSTGTDAPVMKDASSEARKAMVRATSSGWPGLPNACVSLECSRNWQTDRQLGL